MTHTVVVWGLCGLAWSVGFRGWTLQASVSEPQVTWLGTFGGVLLPGAITGMILGWAEHRRGAGRPVHRARWTPDEAAHLRPWVAAASVLLVALLCVAYLGPTTGRALDQGPPQDAWTVTTLCGFVLLLALGCAAPLRRPDARLGPWSLALIGGLCGLAWGCGLRGFMTRVAGDEASMTWTGTFGWVIAPAVVTGAALGWAEHLRRTNRSTWRRHRRWFVLAPLTFAVLLLSEPTEPLAIFEDGIGGGAIGVPLMGMAGGYALAGSGHRWARVLCGVLALAAVPIWATTATSIGGAALSVTTPHGMWVAVLFWSFLAVLSLAASIPHRPPWPLESRPPTPFHSLPSLRPRRGRASPSS